jgi:ribose-phosphate pyrophosphokinase
MIDLNLSRQPDTSKRGISEIDYEIIKFPDGQQDVRLKLGSYSRFGSDIRIHTRLKSFGDLEILLCATAALRNVRLERSKSASYSLYDLKISLNIPYLLGARSDRQFVDGGTSYFKDVVAPIINSQNYSSVYLLDPHSDVSPAVLNNSVILDDVPFVGNQAFKEFYLSRVIVVVPDAGALKRAHKAAVALDDRCADVVCCSKYRDVKTGKITETFVPCEDFKKMDLMIVDDLCDGGRTFIELGKILKQRNCGRIFLCVTHGIFSKGLDELKQYFEKIYTTNSYSDITDPFVYQTKVI